MKYWFFDGNDVVGPFEPKELAARRGFAATSLVCPENYSEDEDSWKMAGSFADFHFDHTDIPSAPLPEVETPAETFEEEMDTLLKERSPLGNLPDSPAADTPSLEIPKKPAKPGPIEDYFNNIKGEDLGNILGIPDPNENSDMNLARALQTQLEKTNPPSDKEVHPIENDPFDEFTTPEEDETDEEPDPLLQPKQTSPVTAPQPAETIQVPPAEAKKDTPKEEPAVSSIPISQKEEDEMVLTLHGQETIAPTPKEAAPSPKEEPVLLTEKEDLPEKSTVQLPVLGQPETLIPALPQDEVTPLQENQPQEAEAPAVAPVAAKEELLSDANDTKADSTPDKTQQPEENSHPEEMVVPQPQEDLKEESQPEELVLSQTQEDSKEEAQPEELVTPKEEVPAEKVNTHPKQEEVTEPKVLQPVGNTAEEASEETDPKEETVRHILDGKLEVEPTPEVPEPIKNVTVEPRVNQIRTRLKQTPEIKAFLNQTRNERIEREKSNKKAMAALSVLIALLAVGAAVYINQKVMGAKPSPAPIATQQPAEKAAPITLQTPEDTVSLLPDIPVPPPPQKIEIPSQEEQALSLVQNYQLPGNRGTVVSYLDRLYRQQLAQGYTGSWSVEPLHKSTYIVKYRLTKTRMEPIVYIFQADVETGKLTGALNNITLDLVGKIQ